MLLQAYNSELSVLTSVTLFNVLQFNVVLKRRSSLSTFTLRNSHGNVFTCNGHTHGEETDKDGHVAQRPTGCKREEMTVEGPSQSIALSNFLSTQANPVSPPGDDGNTRREKKEATNKMCQENSHILDTSISAFEVLESGLVHHRCGYQGLMS